MDGSRILEWSSKQTWGMEDDGIMYVWQAKAKLLGNVCMPKFLDNEASTVWQKK